MTVVIKSLTLQGVLLRAIHSCPSHSCTTNDQTVGLKPLSNALLATFWVCNVAMMAASSVATHLALSLHFFLPGSLGTIGIFVWFFSDGLGMLSRGRSIGGESSGEGHGNGHSECHKHERERRCGDASISK